MTDLGSTVWGLQPRDTGSGTDLELGVSGQVRQALELLGRSGVGR